MRFTTMCLRNLSRRKVRTSLCILGLALGIMLTIAINGASNNYITVIKDMNVFYQGNIVVVSKGSIFVQALSIGGFIQETVVDEIRKVDGVATAVPLIFILGSSENQGVIQIVPPNISVGVPVGNWSVLTGSIPLKTGGRWPLDDSNPAEIVVGASLSVKECLSINSEIEINGKKLKVVGVLDIPSSSALGNIMIIMSLKTAQELYHYQKLISIIIAKPREGVTENVLSRSIESNISGVSALTDDERNEIIKPILDDMRLWSIGIGGAVAGINMVLVMVVSMMNMSERRRELATLDAIGIPKWTMIRLIVTETGLLGLFGCIIGIPLGMVATVLITYFYTHLPLSLLFGDILIHVPPIMAITTLTSTVVLSCVAGLVPALFMARKNIVELMRSED